MAAQPTPATAPASPGSAGTIKRTRLLDALDSARGRIRMLVAPAGYGKTVLAHEWSTAQGRVSVWCPVRSQHVDVAALAIEVARRADAVAPDCGRRLRDRLAAAQEPAVDARLTADMLSEDLADWPSEAWLVLDDYHHILGADDAELFVRELVAGAPINLLVTTRDRPSWVTTRDLMYGDIFELGQAELAMTRDEAGLLLADRPPDERDGLIALADGWPAVIGLARRLPRPVDLSVGFPDEVYDYFAEEVYKSLAPEMRRALCLFALAPQLDRELAAALAGPDAVDAVFREAESIGLMAERDGSLALHPLAATFLLDRTVELGKDRSRAVMTCVEHFRAVRDWDPLFDVILRENLTTELRTTLTEALDDMLNDGRLATVRSVIEAADRAAWRLPVVDLARAEVALREGNSFAAGAHAMRAFEASHDDRAFSFRALCIAARAAHVGNREDEAVALYKRAGMIAATDNERRTALWGLLSSLSQIESNEAWDVLALLRARGPQHVPDEIVRDATRCLMMELRSGALKSLHWGRRAYEVIDQVRDPIARCSFRNVYSGALSMHGDYGHALDIATELQRDAQGHRLKFVLPVAACTAGQALCGLRRFLEAEELLIDALAKGVRAHDTLLEPLAASLLVRLLAQTGRLDDALAVSCNLDESVLSVRGEFLASRGFALACSGRLEEAVDLASRSVAETRAIEPRVLEVAVRAVVSLKRKEPEASDWCRTLLDVAENSNGIDPFVAAYRTSPELLAVLLRTSALRHRITPVISRIGDAEILERAGLVARETGPEATLSKRELEVYELLCAGLSNKQIATCLFISEATVKVHAHHIFDKTGIRSRHALAIDAARRRGTQATETA